MTLFFGTTVYLFSPCYRQTLLVKHKKLQKWVPPGGRIEPGELPTAGACREVLEEIGLVVVLQGGMLLGHGEEVLPPHGLQLNSMPNGTVRHLDFIYHAVIEPQQHSTRVCAPAELLAAQWFAVNKSTLGKVETFPNTRAWIQELCRRFGPTVAPEHQA